MSSDSTAVELQQQLDELTWYHSIDVRPDVATRGWWDLRHAWDLIPWPDLSGKRCLDVGTWDGFYAFEMERRGAAEVVAVDIDDLTKLDFPPGQLGNYLSQIEESTPQSRRAGFDLLHGLLGSHVSLRPGNIYDLNKMDLGSFDVVVVGSLLLHLRDPVRALDAVRQVTAGSLISIEHLNPFLTLLRRRPLFELRGQGTDFQWWIPGERGLERLLSCAGFRVEAKSKRFLLRPGVAGEPPGPLLAMPRDEARRLITYALTRDATRGGHLHQALRCVPSI